MTLKSFEAETFEWYMTAQDHEIDNKHLRISLLRADYKELEGHEAEALFKIAAQSEIQESNSSEKKLELSLKYQVLSD